MGDLGGVLIDLYIIAENNRTCLRYVRQCEVVCLVLILLRILIIPYSFFISHFTTTEDGESVQWFLDVFIGASLRADQSLPSIPSSSCQLLSLPITSHHFPSLSANPYYHPTHPVRP